MPRPYPYQTGFRSPAGIPGHGKEETTIRGQLAEGCEAGVLRGDGPPCKTNRRGEGRPGGSRGPMDENRMEGRQGASRWHNTPKAPGMPLEVNAAAVRRSDAPSPGEWERSGHGLPQAARRAGEARQIPPPEGGGKPAEAMAAGGTGRSAGQHGKIAGGPNPTKGRTNEEGIDPATDGPAGDAGRRGGSGRRHGGKHGAPRERTMVGEILAPENLAAAWRRVKADKGAPGIDGMTIAVFPAFARKHRPGIPTVLDRVIQQAVAQAPGPLFEAGFSGHGHGYRPGRSAHQAVAVMEESWREGRRHAVECDLKSFFGTVNHDRLMNALREKVRRPPPRVPGLIRRYLAAGVAPPDGTREAPPPGECPGAARSHPCRPTSCPTRPAGSWRRADTGSRDAPTTSS